MRGAVQKISTQKLSLFVITKKLNPIKIIIIAGMIMVFHSGRANGLKCHTCAFREHNSVNPHNMDCLDTGKPNSSILNVNCDGDEPFKINVCFKGYGTSSEYGQIMDRGCIYIDTDKPIGNCVNMTEFESRPSSALKSLLRKTPSGSGSGPGAGGRLNSKQKSQSPFKTKEGHSKFFCSLFEKIDIDGLGQQNTKCDKTLDGPHERGLNNMVARFKIEAYTICFCDTDDCNDEPGMMAVTAGRTSEKLCCGSPRNFNINVNLQLVIVSIFFGLVVRRYGN